MYRLQNLMPKLRIKGKLSDSFTNYNYVGNTKVSVSIKGALSDLFISYLSAIYWIF